MQQLSRFMFWLVLLALPLQGFAQAGFLSCHMDRSGASQHATMDHGMSHTGDHQAAAKADLAKKACCTCAVACTVMAMPTSVTELARVDQALPAFTELTPFVPTQAPVPPDRPPRLFSL